MDYNDALQVLKDRYVVQNHGVLAFKTWGNADLRFTACAWLAFVPVVMPPCDYVAIGMRYYEGTTEGSALSGAWNAGHVPQGRLQEILGSLLTRHADPVVHLVYSGGMSQSQAEEILLEALRRQSRTLDELAGWVGGDV